MTQEAKHTPGPWRTDEYGNIVCYPEGLSVGVLSRQLPEGELKANHQLIVAAPELLELAFQYRSDLRHPPAPDSVERRLKAIDAAIGKATA